MPFDHVLRALWRRKLLLIAVPAVISLIFGLILYNLPRSYHAEVHYAIRLDAPTLQKLVDRFYSGENQQRLTAAFQEAGLEEALKILANVEDRNDLVEFIALEATPDYIDYAQKQNMKLSFERTWAENIEKLEQLTAEFLTMHIQGVPKAEMEAVIPLIRHNFESQIPLYDLRDHWINSRIETQTRLAHFIARKRNLELDLQKAENILEKLKAINASASADSGLRIQINIDSSDEKGRFLPLPLRIQSYESEVSQLREQLADDMRRYQQQDTYDQLLAAMLDKLEPLIKGGGSLQQIESGIQSLEDEAAEDPAKEFLASHRSIIRRYSLARQPITQNAAVIPQAKGTIAKTMFVFVILAMICVLAVAIEDYTKRKPVRP